MWFNITKSMDKVEATRDFLAREMASADISKAQKLACECAKIEYKEF